MGDDEVLRRWQDYCEQTGQHGDTPTYTIYALDHRYRMEVSLGNDAEQAGALQRFFDEMFGVAEVALLFGGVIVAIGTATGHLLKLLQMVTGGPPAS